MPGELINYGLKLAGPFFMLRDNAQAIFGGMDAMKNIPLLNTMRTGYATFIEGIADSGTDAFVKLDEIRSVWKEVPNGKDPVFTKIVDGKVRLEDIADEAKGHEKDEDYDTKDIGFGVTWKDIYDWAKRGNVITEGVVGDIGKKIAKKVAPLAVAAGVGFGAGVGAGPAVKGAVNDVEKAAKQSWHDAGNWNAAMNSASRWNASADLLGNWKYVDYKDKPGVYSDSLNHTALSEIAGEESMVYPSERIKVGWKVAPDGKTLMSTVTGRVYKPAKSFFDKDFKREDLGAPVGVGVLYIDKSLDDVAFPWDVEAMYGK